MEKDSYGMTPLMAAAVTGHTKIVEYLTTQYECSREQKVDALELLGATYVDKKRDMLGALNYWRQSLEERSRDPVIDKPKTQLPKEAYENSLEVQSAQELDELISEPDDMRMQALLVRERILGPAHPDTSYYIRYRGAVYADMGNFDRCIMLWTYALDMQQKILEPLSPMTQSSLLSFAELFSFMITERKFRPAYPVSFQDMVIVLEKALKELSTGQTHMLKMPVTERDMTHFNRLIIIIMHLICLMCKIYKRMREDELDQLKYIVYRLVKLDIRGAKGQTPLHLACSKDTSTVGRYPVCTFPSPDVVTLLIDVGADINAVDSENNMPLHVAAANNPCKSDIIQLLLAKGAHLDSCNGQRKTPMQLMKKTLINDILCPLNFTNLQCLAARRIVELGIQYKGNIPRKLEPFVEMH